MENLNKLPFVNISKENLELMDNLLEKEQIGNVISAIYHYCYNGVEPQLSKVEMGVFKNIISVIERKGKAYLNKIEAGTENFKKANQERKQKQNPNQPIQDEVIIVPEGERTRLPKDEYGKKMWSLMKMADENRVKATKAEKAAKDYLQKKGLKFVFQKPIIANMNGYIADFYFPDIKLILEIDGGYHEDFEQRKADIKRTKDLNAEGIKVVRMKNEDVYDFNYPKEIFNKTKKKIKQ